MEQRLNGERLNPNELLDVASLLDHFSRSKEGKDQKINKQTSQNFLRGKKVLINIFSTILFIKHTYFNTLSKSPVISFPKTNHFSALP